MSFFQLTRIFGFLAIVFLPTSLLFSAVPVVSAVSPDFQIQPLAAYLSDRLLYPDAQDIISVVALNGFSGDVYLNLAPSPGLLASVDRSTLTLDTRHALNTSLLLMTANSPGIYKINVTGIAGALSHTVTITLNMTATATRDFQVYPLRTTDRIVRGSSDQIYVSFSSSGFAGVVNLQVGSFPDGLLVSQSSSAVSLEDASSSSAGDNLNVSVPPSAPLGSYILYLISTSGSLVHLSIIKVFAESAINISASANSLKVKQGEAVSTALQVSGLGGYEGTLMLQATYDSQYFTVHLGRGTIDLSQTIVTGNTTVTINASPLVPSSNYPVTIMATDGTVHNSTTINVRIVGLDFSIVSNPSDLTFQEGAGAVRTSTITVASLNGFSGNVNVSIAISPPTTTYPPSSYSPTGITLDPIFERVVLTSGEVKSFTLTVTAASDATKGPRTIVIDSSSSVGSVQIRQVATVKITVGPDFTISSDTNTLIVHQGFSGSITVSLKSLNGFSGGIRLGPGDLLLDGEHLGVNPPSPSITYYDSYPRLSAGGMTTSTIIVKATSDTDLGVYDFYFGAEADTQPCCIDHQIYVKLIIEGPLTPDFTISMTPTILSVTLGSTATSLVTVTSQNGFAGNILLETNSPNLAKITPSSVTLTPGGSVTASLTLTPQLRHDLLGTYPIGYQSGVWPIRIIGVKTSDGTGHDAWVNATYAPFNIATSPSVINLKPGDTGSTKLVLTGVYNWTGSVNLTTTIHPEGSIVKIDQTNLTITQINTNAITTLSVTIPANMKEGNYTMIVSAQYFIPILASISRMYNVNFTTPITIRVLSSDAGNKQPSSALGFLSSPLMYGLLGIGITASGIAVAVFFKARKGKHSTILAFIVR